MRRSDVLERCRLAAEAIKNLPSREWPDWICWILESLDEETESDFVLQTILEDVKRRLDIGRW